MTAIYVQRETIDGDKLRSPRKLGAAITGAIVRMTRGAGERELDLSTLEVAVVSDILAGDVHCIRVSCREKATASGGRIVPEPGQYFTRPAATHPGQWRCFWANVAGDEISMTRVAGQTAPGDETEWHGTVADFNEHFRRYGV